MRALLLGALALTAAASLTLAPASRADDPPTPTHFGAWGVNRDFDTRVTR